MLKVKVFESNDEYNQVDNTFEKLLNLGITVCGLDTETTVFHQSKEQHTVDGNGYYSVLSVDEPLITDGKEKRLVSIIQICIDRNSNNEILDVEIEENDDNVYTCYIIPIKRIYLRHGDIPKNLKKFLMDRSIIKTGCGITKDMKDIKKSYNIKCKGYIDLQDISRSTGNLHYKLDDLGQKYLNLGKMKGSLGDYDGKLTDKQIRYAAYDSYLSLAVYLKMLGVDRKNKVLFYTEGTEGIGGIGGTEGIGVPGGPEKNGVDGLSIEYGLINAEDHLELFKFLKDNNIFLSSQEYETKIISNRVKNGFAKWRDDVGTIAHKVYQCLHKLKEQNLIREVRKNVWTLCLVPPNEEQRVANGQLEGIIKKVQECCTKTITVHGIKKESLVKSLINSLPHLNIGIYDIEGKVIFFSKLIDVLIARGTLRIGAKDKLYLE